MSLFATRTAEPAPVEPPPPARKCVACGRTEQRPAVVLEPRILGDRTTALACINPTECRRHWRADW